MKTMSQVSHIAECPETLDEARLIIMQKCNRLSVVESQRDKYYTILAGALASGCFDGKTAKELRQHGMESFKDKERLDWLEKYPSAVRFKSHFKEGTGWCNWYFTGVGDFNTLREAIDEIRKIEQ